MRAQQPVDAQFGGVDAHGGQVEGGAHLRVNLADQPGDLALDHYFGAAWAKRAGVGRAAILDALRLETEARQQRLDHAFEVVEIHRRGVAAVEALRLARPNKHQAQPAILHRQRPGGVLG